MYKTIVAASLAVAGAAMPLSAQTLHPLVEIRLVVDGDPDAPTGPGIISSAPGATMIGLTLQARLLTYGNTFTTSHGVTFVSHNYGVSSMSAQDAAHYASITENDPLSVGVMDTLQRAPVSPTHAGVFDPYRLFIAGASNYNAPTGNPAGASLAPVDYNFVQNGFIDQDPATHLTRISGMQASMPIIYSGVDPDTNGGSTLPPNIPFDYGIGTDANPTISDWANIYRFYFVPDPTTLDDPASSPSPPSGGFEAPPTLSTTLPLAVHSVSTASSTPSSITTT